MTNTPQPNRRWWVGGAVAVVFVIGLFALGLYRWGWHGPITRIVSAVVPYPAAIVDGTVIRWSDLQKNLLILQRFYEKQKPRAAPGSIFPTDAELQQRVLDRLVRDQLAAELAERDGISVSAADVSAAYDRAVIQNPDSGASSRAAARLFSESTLEELYGLSAGDYRSLILRPLLLRRKLEEKIRQDDALNADKLQKALAAEGALKSGQSFKETALQYSEDPNLETSFGARGLIGPGLMPPEVDAALVNAKKGDIVGPIKSALGYHVLKVGVIKTVSGVKKITLEEIIIYPIKLDDWLEAQLKKANVITFVH